jgi:hypothetical protein
MKNPNLCERPYCRTPWSWLVAGYRAHWKSSWTLHVCAAHAAEYQHTEDSIGTVVTLSRRPVETVP